MTQKIRAIPFCDATSEEWERLLRTDAVAGIAQGRMIEDEQFMLYAKKLRALWLQVITLGYTHTIYRSQKLSKYPGKSIFSTIYETDSDMSLIYLCEHAIETVFYSAFFVYIDMQNGDW